MRRRLLLALVLLTILPTAAFAADTSVITLLRQSQQAAARDQLDAALGYVDQALAQDPAYPPLWNQKASLLLRAKEYAKAYETLSISLRLDPENRDTNLMALTILLRLDAQTEGKDQTLAHYVAGLNDAMVATLLRDIMARPDGKTNFQRFLTVWKPASESGQRLAKLATDYLDGSESAIRDLAAGTTAEPFTPVLGALQFYAAKDMVAAKKLDLATDLLTDAQKNGFDPVTVSGEQGWIFYKQGNPAKAAALWEQYWRQAPDIAKWLSWIAEAELAAEDYAKAAEFLEKGLGFDPHNPVLQGRYLLALRVSGQGAAADAFEEKCQAEPVHDGLYYGQALVALHKGDAGAAAEALTHVENRQGFREQFQALAESVLTRLAKSATAEAAIKRLGDFATALEVQSGVLRDLGWQMWANHRPDAALAFWKQSLANGLPAEDPLLARIVPLLLEIGKSAQVADLLKTYAPQVTPLGLAASLAAANRWDVVGKALPIGQTNPYAMLFSALAALQGGQTAQALGALRTVGSLPAGGLGRQQVVAFDAKGAQVATVLTPERASQIYRRIAQTLLEQQITDGFFFLVPPAWVTGLDQKTIAAQLAEASIIFIGDNRLDDAKQFLVAALGHDPNQPRAKIYEALLAKRQGQNEEAAALLEQALRGASTFDRHYVQGEFALLDGDRAKALTELQSALAEKPDNSALRQRVIGLLVAENRFEEARGLAQWFEARVAKGEKGAFGSAAEVRLELGNPGGAATLYRTLVASHPTATNYISGLARAHNAADQYEATVATLSGPYAATGDSVMGSTLCEALMALGRYEDVVTQAEIGLAAHPEDRELLRLAAEASESLGRFAACADYARRLTALDPDSVHMQTLLARALLNLERYPEAKEQFEAMLARNPDQSTSLRGLLTIYQQTGKAREAYAAAKTLDAVQPDNASVQLSIAVAAAADHAFGKAFPKLDSVRTYGRASAVACLYYRGVTDTDAAGTVRLSQLAGHLRLLADREATFLSLEELAARPVGDKAKGAQDDTPTTSVVVFIDNTDAAVLDKIDALLANLNAKAVLVVGGESMVPGTPYLPDAGQVQRLLATGRWSVAVTDRKAPLATVAQEANKLGVLKAHLEALVPRRLLPEGTRSLAFIYPDGGSPDELLGVDADTRAAYAQAVAETFPLAFILSDEGFWTPMSDPHRIAAKAVLPGYDSAGLATILDQNNPMCKVTLEAAKVDSWNDQFAQAEEKFKQAEALHLNPAEIAYNRAANAYNREDDPNAVALARKAVELAPDSPRAADLLRRAELRTHPKAEAMFTGWWDSDNRRYVWFGLGGTVHVRDDLTLFARGGRAEWFNQTTTSLTGSLQQIKRNKQLDGEDLLVGSRWFFHPGYWLEAQGQLTRTDTGPGTWAGGQLTVHGPIMASFLKLDGTWEVQGAHENIDTVEAVKSQITANRIGAVAHTRILNFWDLFVNAQGIARTDGNTTASFEGRFLRRLLEFPIVSLGYACQFADSDRNPTEYWAPLGLVTHMAYGSLGYAPTRWLNLTGSLGYGVSRDRTHDWREVLRANAGMDITMDDRLKFSLNYSLFNAPDYTLNQLWASISYTF